MLSVKFLYISLEEMFSQTIEVDTYKVFIQECGNGRLYVKKYNDYFEVLGTPNLDFDWEVKAIQKGYRNTRLEKFETGDKENIIYGNRKNRIRRLSK